MKTNPMTMFCKRNILIYIINPLDLYEINHHFRSKLEETKEKQKLRNKPNGVNIMTLAVGKKITVEEEVTNVSILELFEIISLLTVFFECFFRKTCSTQKQEEW